MPDDSKIGPDGTIYERNGWSGQYEPRRGFMGPDQDKDWLGRPNIERGWNGDQRATDGWGRPLEANDGTPLYERYGSGGGGGGGGGSGGGSSASSDLAGGIIWALILLTFWLSWQVIKVVWAIIVWIHRQLYARYGNTAWLYEFIGYGLVVAMVVVGFGIYALWSSLPAYSSPTVPTPIPTVWSTAPTLGVTATHPLPRPTPTSNIPSGVVNASTLILREGPDTSYGIVDRLPQGTVVTLLARNSAGDWFQVNVPTRAKQGWVAAKYLDIPISPSALPVTASIPPTRMLALNTATPPSPPGVIINYYVEQDVISRGACTVLHWGIENVQALYLNGEGVEGWAERPICPDVTSTYTMRIVLTNASVIERYLVVRVQ